ncbi:hypothetical protein [Bosea sp. BH3]|uniref:hypothetical protein n=1 Tax=Bosea sp. BH3 TaxID=2871701 RepID=UPI0021CB5490|nr:hypothetical protein [Bosea sp. BH3]MCU4180588.1 hypothetical protein [Bosea sp. BH3]
MKLLTLTTTAFLAILATINESLSQNSFMSRSEITLRDLSNGPIGLPPQIPKKIADSIKSAPNIKDILPITGSESFNQQIIKAEDIVFDKDSKLIIKNLSNEWIAIAARRIKFRDPLTYSFIERDMSMNSAPDGRAGATGPRGADRPGETNRRGNNGDPGGPGGTGEPGATRQLPTIYIIAEQLLDENSKPIPPGILNLALIVRGFDGGMGGAGGRGGDGGNAGNGKEGADSLFDCKEGPGPGGDGGAAGMGGMGGAAGNGGAGATLVFVSLKQGAETFSYSRVNNQGGRAGLPGRGGPPGLPGRQGDGAPRNGWCGPSGPGSPGSYPNPANLGNGSIGQDGPKGEMFIVSVTSLDDFLKK